MDPNLAVALAIVAGVVVVALVVLLRASPRPIERLERLIRAWRGR